VQIYKIISCIEFNPRADLMQFSHLSRGTRPASDSLRYSNYISRARGETATLSHLYANLYFYFHLSILILARACAVLCRAIFFHAPGFGKPAPAAAVYADVHEMSGVCITCWCGICKIAARTVTHCKQTADAHTKKAPK
jgi:hypothetical protein